MSSPLSKEKETFNFKFKFMKNYHFKGTKKLRPKYEINKNQISTCKWMKK